MARGKTSMAISARAEIPIENHEYEGHNSDRVPHHPCYCTCHGPLNQGHVITHSGQKFSCGMTHKETDRHFFQPDKHLFPQVTNDALADVGHQIVLAEVTGPLQHVDKADQRRNPHKHGRVSFRRRCRLAPASRGTPGTRSGPQPQSCRSLPEQACPRKA